uniref:Putative salivary kunitz domain protein n=1 Tax=Ixodes ricinus TaxID=34613 RepID=A0A0K8RK90_IXORI
MCCTYLYCSFPRNQDVVKATSTKVLGNQLTSVAKHTGTAECETTATVPPICYMDPNEGEGKAMHPGWFYDNTIDSCLVLVFGAPQAENEVVNRFETREHCSKTCRPHIKSFCFDDPPVTSNGPISKWFYNSTQAKCFMIKVNGQTPEDTNLFDTEVKCKKTCRDPDYGPCAKRPPKSCKETDVDYYRYDINTERCVYDAKQRCKGENGFLSQEDCDKRCGRFVQNRCKHRPQNISNWCSTNGDRYYFDERENRCKAYYGCDDHGIAFLSLDKCNQKCLGRY